MIMSTAEHASALDKAVFPGLQGGPHNHTTAPSRSRCTRRPSRHSVNMRSSVANAQALATALTERATTWCPAVPTTISSCST